MASGFAPEFLILLGIDIFLGASILTVLLDRHFPTPFPYVLEGAALIGFTELVSGPSFLTSLSTELQFWYSFIYAMIAVLSLFATNLYLLFLRRRTFESAVLGICGTVPAGLGILYFTSAFVNGLTVSLPLIPVIPIEGIYAMFGLSIGLVVFSLVVFGRKVKPATEPAQEKPVAEPIISNASGEETQLVVKGEPEPAAPSTEPSQPLPEDEPPFGADLGDAPASPSEGGDHGGRPSPGGVSMAGGVPSAVPASEEPESGQKDGDVDNRGTVLVRRVAPSEYVRRLLDSIRFFEKAVDHRVSFDPTLLGGTLRDARKAFLTPAGMIVAEDSAGKTVYLSLMDMSTDEALDVMREVMKGINQAEDSL